MEELELHSDLPRVSILVPAYNEGPLIETSIRSLTELNYTNFEVIVINDGSTDGTLVNARKMEGRQGNAVVRVITQRNMGKSHALNNGASIATGEFLVSVDGDSKLAPNTLLNAIRHFKDPRIGAVAGNVKVINRRNLLTKLQALEYIEGLNMVRRAQAFFSSVNIVPGPIGIFRREALIGVGG